MMSKNTMKPDITITERLRVHSEHSPHQNAYTFLRDDGKVDVITFRELYDDARSLAMELVTHVKSGSIALLLYPSGLEFIKAYLACLYAGIIAVPSSMPRKMRSSQRLRAILADARPSLILTTADCMQIVKSICLTEDPEVRHCLATDAMETARFEQDLPHASPDATAFLQYTSGSTATPNGVAVTHKNIISNVEAIAKALALSKSSIMVGWLPLFHDMGLIANVLAPLYVGFHSVLMSPNYFLKNPFYWLNAISKFRGTCAGSPNFGWDYCVSRISEDKKKELDLSSLEVAYNGSEPVRAHTLQRFHEAFSSCGFRKEALFPCYGMAEATLFVSGGPHNKAPLVLNLSKNSLEGNQIRVVAPKSQDARQIVSCGQVSENLTVVVVDPETLLPCSPRRVGEIWIAGSSVAKGYWNRPDETEKTFRAHLADSGSGPFLRSGDLGFIQDGDLFITGRSKELIVIHGRNIYPQDIEQLIEQSIDFVEPNMCAAFSVDRDNRESLVIIAEANRSLMRAAHFEQRETDSEAKSTVKNEYLAKLEELTSDICTVIAEQFDISVSSIAFVRPGSFPRTSSGKVQRLLCKKMAMSGQLDIVYVMPDSVFDRRQAGEATVSNEIATVRFPAVAVEKAESARDFNPVPHALTGTDRQLSKQKADELIEWFRNYAERRLNFHLPDKRRTVPPHVVLELGNMGFFGLQIPKRLGGYELATADFLHVTEQLAGVDLTLAMLVGVHNGLGVRPILHFADEASRDKILPGLAAGRQLAGFALAEPGNRSTPLEMQATAMKIAGGWLVNAEKQRLGIGSWAGVLTVLAKALDPNGLPLGTIALMMSGDTPGISYGPETPAMDMRGIVQNTMHIKNAFASDSALLGSVGEGMGVVQDAMMFSRLAIGAMSLGAMKRCAQLMLRHAMNRPISTSLPVDDSIAVARLEELTAAILTTESLIYEIADLIDQGETVPMEAYIVCKTAAPELLAEATDNLVQLLGGREYIESDGAAQLFHDARVLRIFEESTETLNMHLGASVLRQSESIAKFISTTLNAAQVADQFLQALAEFKSGVSRFDSASSDELSFEQWRQLQAGRLATAAIIVAAAVKKHSINAQEADSGRAIDWAMRRFADLRHNILAWFSDNRRMLSLPKLENTISQYGISIGVVERVPDREGQALEKLMHPENSLKNGIRPGPQPWPSPVFSDTDSFVSAKSEATMKMVNESVIKWMRTEKRQFVDKLAADVSFSSLGMDSLGAVMLTLELGRRIGIELSSEIVRDCQTVERLANYIDANFSYADQGSEKYLDILPPDSKEAPIDF